ncbi:XRE family transcriptional regulator [Paraburkholderia sp.]|uniref:XRE family transcriptional regulator n=1 Tax=Paraburkholderia sp. TaxID=1926495 RepID=UPI0025DC2DCA|nr:XRE family transcriptional regulator [Paraburkholderia sp.]
MNYTPPTPESLQRLKDALGFSSVQMAELFGLSSGRHWRSYTGGADIRSVSASTLFFAMARLKLSPETIEQVLSAMRELGATIELEAP